MDYYCNLLLGGLFAIRSGIKAMFVSRITNGFNEFVIFLISLVWKVWIIICNSSNIRRYGGDICTVAFVAFISMLVDRTYTATQYAAHQLEQQVGQR